MQTVTYDLETTGLDADKDRIICVGYKIDDQPTKVVFGAPPDELLDALRNPTITVIGHNLSFDNKFMKREWEVVGPYYDTQLAYRLKHPFNSYALKDILKSMGHKAVTLKELTGGSKMAIEDIDPSILAAYCKQDVDGTYSLYQKLNTSVTDWAVNIEFPLIDTVIDMERTGLALDKDHIARLLARLESQVVVIQDKFNGVNLNSPKQVREMLMKQGYNQDLSKYLTNGGQVSTDKLTLRALSSRIPVAQDILKYRELSKLISTYVGKWGGLDTLKGGFNQCGTVTNRFSSSKPNLQNIPARSKEGMEIRECIVSRPGHKLIVGDLSQIEPRLYAHYSQDPALLSVFQNDEDFHGKVAESIYGPLFTKEERFVGKTVGLATLYGASVTRLQETLVAFGKDLPVSKVGYIRKQIYRAFPKAIDWNKEQWRKLDKDRHVQTVGGRLIYPGTKRINPVNYKIQGSCADIIKVVLHNLHEAGYRVLCTVHDEVIIEVKAEHAVKALEDVVWYMENSFRLPDVPIKADVKICSNWAEGK